MKKELVLSLFIVPNHINTLGWVTTSPVGGTHLWDRNKTELKRVEKFFGSLAPFKRGDRFAQVWIHCPAEGDNSNWTDHGIPRQYIGLFDWSENDQDEDNILRAYAPSSVPVDFLQQFKESDEIVLRETDEVVVKLKFEQLPYRYRRFGRFEEVLELLITQFNPKEDQDWHEQLGDVIPVSGQNVHWDWASEYKS